jgi:circadian clock protein KaiB
MRRTASSPKRTPPGSPEGLGGEPFHLGTRISAHRLRLYIAGNDKKSRQAIESLQKIMALFEPGRCSAEIVDLHRHAELAVRDSILAVPALVKLSPPPPTTFIGATTDHFTILRRLGIPFDSSMMTAYTCRRRQS